MKKIYMVGICGTGMGNLALMLKKKGYDVTGSDSNVYPPMSTVLENAGIKILNGYKEENINQLPDIAIIGNVVSRGNVEAQKLMNSDVTYYSMPEALRMFFFDNKEAIVVNRNTRKDSLPLLWSPGCLRTTGQAWFFIGGVQRILKPWAGQRR